jgi:hypothetical protein
MRSLQKRVYIDIENAYAIGAFFGKVYETNILRVLQQSYLLCFSYQWEGEKKIHTVSLPDFIGYRKSTDADDKKVARELWKVLDEADHVVAQNGDPFDIKFANARFIKWGFPPPSPYTTSDTLKLSRKTVYLPSHKLNAKGAYYGYGEKLPNTGEDLWTACMAGEESAWKDMIKYNQQDIRLLVADYKLFAPWNRTPNHNLYSGLNNCPGCGERLQKRGYSRTLTKVYQRFQCTQCGRWCRDAGEKADNKISIR